MVLAASFVAGLISYGVTITPLRLSPHLLVIGVGVVLLAVLGRAQWPAILISDFVVELLVSGRAVPVSALMALVHAGLAVAGAIWVTDHDAWPGNLRTSIRFLIGAVALSVRNGLVFTAASSGMGYESVRNVSEDALWAGVTTLSGFLVGAVALTAWLGPDRRRTGW